MSRDIVGLSKILMDCGVAFVTFPWGHVHILSKAYFKYLIHILGDEVLSDELAAVISVERRNLYWIQRQNTIQCDICRGDPCVLIDSDGGCRDHGLWVSSKSLSWNPQALHNSRRCSLSILIKGDNIFMLIINWRFTNGRLKYHFSTVFGHERWWYWHACQEKKYKPICQGHFSKPMWTWNPLVHLGYGAA